MYFVEFIFANDHVLVNFAKCNFVWGDPIMIPKLTKDNEIEKYKVFLEEEINSCISIAESELNV